MIKWYLITILFFSSVLHAGVSVVGTRFIFNENSNKINIKLMNDNESDYLIKTDIKGVGSHDFVVTPPLFIIKKNQKNIVSIIPFKSDFNQDQVFDLVFTAIPKSDISMGNNLKVSVRSHFNLIYRHKYINDDVLEKIFLINVDSKSDETSKSIILNSSDYFVSMYISCNPKVTKVNHKVNIHPQGKISVKYCPEIWGAILNDDESLGSVKKLQLK